ncbi:MAG TPA: hypothetical protein VJL80_06380 [Aeromicrobium sp.]|nr:hypothetical protein [Aeromicrobium sp.]HKY57645.1 hypothetical protein [Aeromicrobium sp.]
MTDLTPRAHALRFTPGNAFLLGCALGPALVAAVLNVPDHMLDRVIRALARR